MDIQQIACPSCNMPYLVENGRPVKAIETLITACGCPAHGGCDAITYEIRLYVCQGCKGVLAFEGDEYGLFINMESLGKIGQVFDHRKSPAAGNPKKPALEWHTSVTGVRVATPASGVRYMVWEQSNVISRASYFCEHPDGKGHGNGCDSIEHGQRICDMDWQNLKADA